MSEPWQRREVIGNATVYLGDARKIVPTVGPVDAVITDPVWPNCPQGLLPGADGTQDELLAEVLSHSIAPTVVIVMGFDSDPRFLSAVPPRWGFVRSQQLPYAMPGYRGRLLAGDEVAYVFGAIPKGRGVIPGRARTVASTKAARATVHPTPRADEHMAQLCGWWAPEGGLIADWFMGTAAVGVGAVQAGRRFVGIEIEPEYFDAACERLCAVQAQGVLFDAG